MPTTKTPVISAPITPTEPVVDVKTGKFNFAATQWALNLTRAVNSGLNLIGEFIGNIAATATIGNRTEGIGTTVNHIDASGVMQSAGMAPATSAAQGSVVMPLGAVSNVLGGASVHATADFDSAGSAAAAQTAAETFATSAANTAQANAVAIASNASNISSGTLDNSVIPTPGPSALGGVKSISPVANKWVTSIDATGSPVLGQPAFTDISGTATAAQVPALSALTGQITTGQLPVSGLSVTIATAKLTGGGADGSMQFQNGILIAQTPAT